MATAIDQNQFDANLGSEDLCELTCQPCLEIGKIQEAVGMCIDCQDVLCQHCFDVHKTPKPTRNHELINKDQMLKSQISIGRKDKCTEKCTHHDEEVVSYYCTNHCQLGCSVCLALDHRTCDRITYIPRAAKDLDNNEEYKQADNHLRTIEDKFNKLTEKAKQTTESHCNHCSEAVEMVKKFRTEINNALDRIEEDLIKKAEFVKSKIMDRLTRTTEKYSFAITELQQMSLMANKLRNEGMNCELYTFCMKSNDNLLSMDSLLEEAEIDYSFETSGVKFHPNTELLKRLKDHDAFGWLTEIQKESTETKTETRTIVKAVQMNDLNVRIGTDTYTCKVTGSVVLPENSLLLADFDNKCVKYVDIKSNKVLKHLKFSSYPFDVAMVTESQAAVTLPDKRMVAFIGTEDATMAIKRTVDVKERCYGVDFREGKLAVSFLWDNKVQIFNLQGTILFTIENEKHGRALFSEPDHVVFGQDISTLYASNLRSHTVVCVKVDGSVVAKYADNKLENPGGLFIDGSGNVYVCGEGSHNIHHISPDCTNIQILLTKDDGVNAPLSVSYSKMENKIFVGTCDDKLKVYRALLGTL